MVATERLPQEVIEEDHRLDKLTESASEGLARHRWHWTLDESNPKTVSFAQYGRDVGRAASTIRDYANAHLIHQFNDASLFSDALRQAQMSVETASVATAISKARGQSFDVIRKQRPTEVHRVRDLARQRAEDKGTSIEDEASRIAEMIVRRERADQELEDERRKRHGLRFIEAEGYVVNAIRFLAKLEKMVGTFNWDEEEQELLRDSLEKVRRLLGRIDARILGVTEFDWDQELETILKEG